MNETTSQAQIPSCSHCGLAGNARLPVLYGIDRS
jgi:hypothetical protein